MKRWLVPSLCAAMGVVFVAQSWLAVRTKSPTMDEPLHSVGAYLHVFDGDFRINPEDPPLWNYWAMLPHRRGELTINRDDPAWTGALRDTNHQGALATRTLFQSPGNDGVRFINTSRGMMLLAGLALAALLMAWSYRLAGAVGAFAAGAIYCFEPNFLAHAPLVKNDVPISLVMLALGFATWSVGRHVTWWNALLPGLLLGVGLGVKFSGVLLAPMLAIMLLGRVIVSNPWDVLGRTTPRPLARLAIASALLAGSLLLAWAVLWASYGFRFDPTPTRGVQLPMQTQIDALARNELLLRQGPEPADRESWRPGALVRGVLWAEQNRLLPQAWLYGLMFTYQSSLVRSGYLLGEHSVTGWWYYFPLAMLFKTPTATLIAMGLSVMVILSRKKADAKPQAETPPYWSAICLAVPVVVYGLGALTTNLNLGVRHVLPIYPFIFVAIGIAANRAWLRHPRALGAVSSILGAALLVESVASFPNYIPFFNAASRAHRLDLLSDSNLDWGQDLPALAEWVKQNPTDRLYLAYFGTVDPAFYGISDYVHVPGGFWLGPPVQLFDRSKPGVLAVSANVLQGNDLPPEIQQLYAPFRSLRPRAVLGGSIYVFDFPPR